MFQTYHGRKKIIKLDAITLKPKYSPFRLLVITILVLASVLVVFIVDAKWGIGVSPDSVGYLLSAQNILDGKGYTDQDGKAVSLWPFLYPLCLAGCAFVTNMDVVLIVPFFHAFLLASIIVCFFRFSGKLRWRFRDEVIAGLMLLLSVPLLHVASWVWSELLFIFLTILFLDYSSKYVSTNSIKHMLVMAIVAGLSTLTRYIGVTLILTGIIYLLYFNKNEVRTSISRLFLFIIVSSGPLVIFLIRNYLLTGTFAGDRSESVVGLLPQVLTAFNSLSKWYFPLDGVMRIMIITTVLVILAFLIITFKELKSVVKEKQIIMSFVFIAIYFVSTVFLSTITVIDSLGHRLLSPVYVPALIILVSCLGRLLHILSERMKENLLWIGKGLFVSILIMTFTQRVVLEIIPDFSSEWNYMSDRWKKSRTIDFVKHNQHLYSGVIYSNHPDALIFFNRLLSVKITPAKTDYYPVSLEELEGTWPQTDNATLIWFDPTPRNFLYNLDELKKVSELEKIRTFQDGAVYTVRKRLISKEVDQGR